jgi:hypothetical protein
MKIRNIKLLVGTLFLVMFLALTFTGCPEPDSDPTYTVWTDITSYSEYYSVFGSLSDGYFTRYEFSSSEWNSISPSLTSEGRHNWTESQIKNWFIGRGFGNTEATQQVAWLLTINHGFIASRDGNVVDMLLK